MMKGHVSPSSYGFHLRQRKLSHAQRHGGGDRDTGTSTGHDLGVGRLAVNGIVESQNMAVDGHDQCIGVAFEAEEVATPLQQHRPIVPNDGGARSEAALAIDGSG